MPEVRKQKQPRDARQPSWTGRDEDVLRWIGEQYIVSFDQLQVLLSRQAPGQAKEAGRVTPATVRQCLERWQRDGVARYAPLGAGGRPPVWLTRQGLQLAGLAYPLWEPSVARMDYVYFVNEARLWVERRQKGVWYSYRDLHPERKGTKERRGMYELHPYAVWETKGRTATRAAIEVQLGPWRSDTLRERLYRLEQHRLEQQCEAIWYFSERIFFDGLHQGLLGMNQARDQPLKERLELIVWHEEARVWVEKGNAANLTEDGGIDEEI